MATPEIQRPSELAAPLPINDDLLSQPDKTAESIQAFRDQQTARIQQLVAERSGLALRTREIRIALGKEIADLQSSYAHPGDGDFVKRIESVGLAIATAYRYVALYKKSLSHDKDLSSETTVAMACKEGAAGKEKESPQGCDVGESSGTEPPQKVHIRKPRRHGYVDVAELEARRTESQSALPALEVVKLEFTSEELLNFEVYIKQLSEPFQTKDKNKIVLWALQRICGQYGYEDVATGN